VLLHATTSGSINRTPAAHHTRGCATLLTENEVLREERDGLSEQLRRLQRVATATSSELCALREGVKREMTKAGVQWIGDLDQALKRGREKMQRLATQAATHKANAAGKQHLAVGRLQVKFGENFEVKITDLSRRIKELTERAVERQKVEVDLRAQLRRLDWRNSELKNAKATLAVDADRAQRLAGEEIEARGAQNAELTRQLKEVERARDEAEQAKGAVLEEAEELRGQLMEMEAMVEESHREVIDPTFMDATRDVDSPCTSTLAEVRATMEKNTHRGGNAVQYSTDIINGMADITREFELSGATLAALFHAVLAMFTGWSREEATTTAQPAKPQRKAGGQPPKKQRKA